MLDGLDALMLARIQFGFTVAFHIRPLEAGRIDKEIEPIRTAGITPAPAVDRDRVAGDRREGEER